MEILRLAIYLHLKDLMQKCHLLSTKIFSPNLFQNPYNKTSPQKGAKKVPKGYFLKDYFLKGYLTQL